MADQYSIQDQNQFAALTAHSDTTNDAETRRVVATDGALHVLDETLQELLGRISTLSSVVANTQQLRAVVTGAVTATGGGYVTSAQVVAALLTQTNSQRFSLDNTLAVLANVNNCTGA